MYDFKFLGQKQLILIWKMMIFSFEKKKNFMVKFKVQIL